MKKQLYEYRRSATRLALEQVYEYRALEIRSTLFQLSVDLEETIIRVSNYEETITDK